MCLSFPFFISFSSRAVVSKSFPFQALAEPKNTDSLAGRKRCSQSCRSKREKTSVHFRPEARNLHQVNWVILPQEKQPRPWPLQLFSHKDISVQSKEGCLRLPPFFSIRDGNVSCADQNISKTFCDKDYKNQWIGRDSSGSVSDSSHPRHVGKWEKGILCAEHSVSSGRYQLSFSNKWFAK